MEFKIKLKKDNKGLKETIKSLTSQLDRVCSIAEKVKNNEINTLQLNEYNNGQEKNILLSQIDTLTKEKEELKKQVEIKEEKYQNYKKNEEINKNKLLIEKENKHRKFFSELSNEYENIKQINTNLSITVNKEISDNQKFRLIINKLNQENEMLKKKLDEQKIISNNAFKDKLNDKEKQIQNLTKENNTLKQNIKNLKIVEKKYEDINNENKILNEIKTKYNSLLKENNEKDIKINVLEGVDKENKNLNNKLSEAGKTISDYMKKYDDITKKYYKLKNTYKKQEGILGELNNQVSIFKNKIIIFFKKNMKIY